MRALGTFGNILSLTCDHCELKVERTQQLFSQGKLECEEWMTFHKGFKTSDGAYRPSVLDFCPSCSRVILDLLVDHRFTRGLDLERLVVAEEKCPACNAPKGTLHTADCAYYVPPQQTPIGEIWGNTLGVMNLFTAITTPVWPLVTHSTTTEPPPSTTVAPIQRFHQLNRLYNPPCDDCGHDYNGHSRGGGACPCGCEQYAPPP